MKRRAVFLDRDGVLNRAYVAKGVPHPPSSLDQLEVLPGVVDACRLLRQAGLLLIVVTNQPDLARGTQRIEIVDEINEALRSQVGFDDLYVCPHDDSDNCNCRKPRPGMLLKAAAAHDVDLAGSVMVGDRDRDIAAGQAAGCQTVLVGKAHGRPPVPPADLTVEDLRAAVDWIVDHTAAKKGVAQ
jgi:D-glycero-D-manno-heptose 1,7-bisphosphate phosphatase